MSASETNVRDGEMVPSLTVSTAAAQQRYLWPGQTFALEVLRRFLRGCANAFRVTVP